MSTQNEKKRSDEQKGTGPKSTTKGPESTIKKPSPTKSQQEKANDKSRQR